MYKVRLCSAQDPQHKISGKSRYSGIPNLRSRSYGPQVKSDSRRILRNLALLLAALGGGFLFSGCAAQFKDATQFKKPAGPQLTIDATSVSFGTVTVNTPATQVVTLTSTGGSPVKISAVTVSGTGFTVSGIAIPLTLKAGQSATVNLQFSPVTTGSATGVLTITSDSTTDGTALIPLSGTGGTATVHQVDLSWNAPTNTTDTVVSYNVYRTMAGSTSYQQLSSIQAPTTQYVDQNVQSGSTYDYEVTSVGASGIESVPSNTTSATIP